MQPKTQLTGRVNLVSTFLPLFELIQKLYFRGMLYSSNLHLQDKGQNKNEPPDTQMADLLFPKAFVGAKI